MQYGYKSVWYKNTWLILSVIGLLLGLGIVFAFMNAPQAVIKQEPPEQKELKHNTVSVVAMGDMLAYDSVVDNAKTVEGYDFTKFFSKINSLYKDSDVIFCNQEGPTAGPSLGISGYPLLNGPTEFARDLQTGAGCNLINIANDHIADKGQPGIDATIDVWKKLQPLAIAGANKKSEDQNTVQYFTKNDIKIAFVAFADTNNNASIPTTSVNIYHDEKLVRRLLTDARANADFVFVSVHWGTENSPTANEDQEKTSKLFAELGADVVVGTGPHVIQKVAYVNGVNNHRTLVWYSIGNMLSTQQDINELTGGLARFTINKIGTAHATIGDLTFIPTFMSYVWSPKDRGVGKLQTRTDLMIYPLSSAETAINAMFPGYSVNERRQYVRTALGNYVSVELQ
ncbi:MAG: CapA family protein [Candidatus Saccharimonadales bacterium]